MKKIIFTLFAVFTFFNIAQTQTTRLFQSMIHSNDLIEVDDEIWFATRKGVTRMNKSTLERTVYTMHNSGLPSEDIKEIAIDNEGNIWVGTYDLLLTIWTGDDWNVVASVDFPLDLQLQLPENSEMYSMEFDSNNNLWIGSNNGIAKFDGTNWDYWNKNNTTEQLLTLCWDIVIDDDNNVIVASHELYNFDGTTWKNYTDVDSTLASYIDPDVFKSNDGSIWFTNGGEYAKLIDNEWIKFNETTDGANLSGTAFVNSGNDNPILFSTIGYYTLENGLWKLHTDAQFDAFDWNKNFYYIDHDSNRWLGSHNLLSKASGNDLTQTHINEVPLYSNYGHQIVQDNFENTYIINGGWNIAKYNEAEGMTHFQPEKNPDLSHRPYYYHIAFAPNNDMWLASNHGLSRFDGTTWDFFTPSTSSIPSANIDLIKVDHDGHLWGFGEDGLVHYDGNDWQLFDLANSILTSLSFRRLAIDNNNVVWLYTQYQNPQGPGLTYEIYRIENGIWTMFNSTNALLPSGTSPNGLFVDENNQLWVSFNYSQVFMYDGEDWNNIQEFNDDTKRVRSIAGGLGKIYCSVKDEGIAVLENDEWTYLTPNNSDLISDENLNLMVDHEGSLWMSPSGEGIQVYNADGFSTNLELIENDPNNLNWKISPNPATEMISINFLNNDFTKNNQLDIFNINGQLLLQIQLGEMQKGEQQFDINISGLSSGIYFVHLTNEHQSGFLKFSKQ